MKRFNWRQVLVHVIAAALLTYACQLFGYFRDVAFLRVLLKGDEHLTMQYIKDKDWGITVFADYVNFVLWETWVIGFFLALLISLCVAWWRRWWWVNSITAIVLYYIVEFTYTRLVEGHDGALFSIVHHFPFPASVGALATVGVLSTMCSCYLFLSGKVAKIIEKGIQAQ